MATLVVVLSNYLFDRYEYVYLTKKLTFYGGDGFSRIDTRCCKSTIV